MEPPLDECVSPVWIILGIGTSLQNVCGCGVLAVMHGSLRIVGLDVSSLLLTR